MMTETFEIFSILFSQWKEMKTTCNICMSAILIDHKNINGPHQEPLG